MDNWSAVINVKWNNKFDGKNWEWLKEWAEVQTAWSTMGSWDMSIWVNLDSPASVEEFVHGKLRNTDWVADTETHWVKQVWNAA
jgi:DNA-binding Lrp family transcriptional regulator